jgi:hypothetical protein
MSLRGAALVTAGLLGALLLTLASMYWERRGPELVENGNLCGPNRDEICWEPALKGGLPLAWVRDIPTISVPGKLHWAEDRVDVAAFWIDVAFWFGVLALLRRVTPRASPRPPPR